MRENFELESFIEIVGLNLYGVLSKDLSIYMKTFLNEIKKKSKCKNKNKNKNKYKYKIFWIAYMIKEAKSLTTIFDNIEDSKLLEIFKQGKPGIRS